MTDLFLERRFRRPMTPERVIEQALEAYECLDMHRVRWEASYLAAGGSRMICWFRAPDAESARIALRGINADLSVLWPGAVYDKPGSDASDIERAKVLVERSFEGGASLQDIQAIEDAGAHCLEIRDVSFKRTFHSLNGERMICLYDAPDAESVREAQREAGVPFDDAWAFELVRIEDPPPPQD